MGNGAIVPFYLPTPEDPGLLTQMSDNIETIERFYQRVYGDRSLDAIVDLVTPDVVIHRDGQKQIGPDALRSQIDDTFWNRDKLAVDLQQKIATPTSVAYTLKVSYTDVHGTRIRVCGLSMSRLEGGLIAETWVNYGSPEPDT